MKTSNRSALAYLVLALLAGSEAVHGKSVGAQTDPATASGEETAAEPTKLALLVGINEYRNGIAPLDGAVNDVAVMKKLLVDFFGFVDDEEHIRVLTDAEATREGILGAFRQHLIDNPGLGPESIVVFHYSGHGSQMPDVSGDETDPWDETLVPQDSGRKPHPNRDITDDEINALISELSAKTPNVTFIFDSCHSGTATRGAGKARTVAPDERTPPERQAGSAARGEGRSDLRPGDAEYTLISAAAAKELAREKKIGGASYGALTWHLAEEIRKAALGKKEVTYSDIMDKVKLEVTADFPAQHPQLEVSGDVRYVFSARSRRAQPYVLASPAPGGKIELDAGQVQGVTAGSVYEVYPPDAADFDAATPSARVEIESVGVTRSIAKRVSGRVRQKGSKAVEVEHRFPDAEIRVHLMGLADSETLQAIGRELESYRHIVQVDEPTGYDLLVREDNGTLLTEGGDPTPLSPGVAASHPRAVSLVVEQLTRWARWLGVLAIENRDPAVDVAFEVRTTRSRGASSFMEQDVDLTMGVGDQFEISVTNNSERDVYVAVLDLESDGSVSVVFPSRGNEEFVAPGKTWSLQVEATLPDDRERVRDVLKLFATTTPCRFDFLQQEAVTGTRGLSPADGRGRNALEELLSNSARGTTRGEGAPKVDAWTTAELVLEVRRVGEPEG